ncbi:MAG: hypothetical protein AAB593_02565 [Patescibacteria group bacterium]
MIKKLKKVCWKWTAILFIVIFIITQVFGFNANIIHNTRIYLEKYNDKKLIKTVIPESGFTLPVVWEGFGKQMIEKEVIDAVKFEKLYYDKGGIPDDIKELLYSENNTNIKINPENAGFILNLFWAFGLSNKNPILEQGPMTNKEYGGAQNFASTGGWTLSKENAMNYYSKYSFTPLNKEQQELVEKVSKNIFRPCCGNSVYFPDCNHGMAMLGLLELMAYQGINEQEMYNVALVVNSYWFPETYITIAKYFENRGVLWEEVKAKEVLSSSYSSAQGFREVLNEVSPPKIQGGSGNSCGV